MRFFFIGLIIIFLVSLLIGQFTTPKKTPFKKVLAKGLYYSIIGLIGFVIAIGIVALVNDFNARAGSQSDFAKMTKEQKASLRDSLKKAIPAPDLAELKSTFVAYNFDGVLIPCYETVHKLDVASLKEIKSLNQIEESLSDDIYDIETEAELIVNQPASGFHIKGIFNVQYEFYEGDSDIDPGWKFKTILISNCTVLDAPLQERATGNIEHYPDLNRDMNEQ